MYVETRDIVCHSGIADSSRICKAGKKGVASGSAPAKVHGKAYVLAVYVKAAAVLVLASALRAVRTQAGLGAVLIVLPVLAGALSGDLTALFLTVPLGIYMVACSRSHKVRCESREERGREKIL